jgi:hypothetical protein
MSTPDVVTTPLPPSRAASAFTPRRIATIVVVLAFALAPQFLGKFGVSLLNDMGIGALVALGLVMLTGVGGATSFGQAAFVGIAAYATAWLTTAHGASPWFGLLLALALTGGAAVVIGAITLRLGGHYLPLSTIAWGCPSPCCSATSRRWAATPACRTCRRCASGPGRCWTRARCTTWCGCWWAWPTCSAATC